MADYIDRNSAIDALRKFANECPGSTEAAAAAAMAISVLSRVPGPWVDANGMLPVSRDQLRPCYTGDGRRALFHRWADTAEPIAPSPFVGGQPAGQFWRVHGIVEFEDGTVCRLLPEEIKFLDSMVKMRCYAWDSAAQPTAEMDA